MLVSRSSMELTRLLGPWSSTLTSLALCSITYSKEKLHRDNVAHSNVLRGLKRLGSLRHLYLFEAISNYFKQIAYQLELPQTIIRQLDSLVLSGINRTSQIDRLSQKIAQLKPAGLSCRLSVAPIRRIVPELTEMLSRESHSHFASLTTHLSTFVTEMDQIAPICRVFTSLRYLKLTSLITVRLKTLSIGRGLFHSF